MTTFDERERSFEKKFAIDQERKFKAAARCATLIGEWAAARLAVSGAAAEDYVRAVRKIGAGQGEDAVFEKVLGDLAAKGIPVTPLELREVIDGFAVRVKAELAAEGKGG